MTARLANSKVVKRGVMNTERAAKVAAKRIGIPVEEYQERRATGEKWCWACQRWHRLDAFKTDRSRRDGCSNICREAHCIRYPYAQPLSLDEAGGPFGGGYLRDVIVDPSISYDDYGEIDAAERLRKIVGDMEPEDVRLLDSRSLARLQERLRVQGLVPRGVMLAERKRLASPDRVSGASVTKAPLIVGRKTRAQKVRHKAINRAQGNSNRPSQKPRDQIRELRRQRQRERDAV